MYLLDMDCFLDRGELDVERRALARGRAHINLSGMLFDNAVTHGKTEPVPRPRLWW